jgi:DNA-binding response OmpR family regulator
MTLNRTDDTARPTGTERRRILVVDDQPTVLEGVQMFFSAAGHEVTACGTFADARRALQTSAYDLLLTDIRLGAFNGLQLALIARQQDPQIRIAVFSGVDDAVLREEASRLSATYLVKPVGGHQLLELCKPALVE